MINNEHESLPVTRQLMNAAWDLRINNNNQELQTMQDWGKGSIQTHLAECSCQWYRVNLYLAPHASPTALKEER